MSRRNIRQYRVSGPILLLGFIAAAAIFASGSSDTTLDRENEVANGYLPYHELDGEDFRVNDILNPGSRIYTAGFFHYEYRYRYLGRQGDFTARVISWVVWSGFDRNKSSRKSWFTPTIEDLKHEQGHLDLNEIYSRRLADLNIASLPVGTGPDAQQAGEDLKKKIEALADQYSREAQSEQDKYDAETAHGRNAAKQREATAAIQVRLGGQK